MNRLLSWVCAADILLLSLPTRALGPRCEFWVALALLAPTLVLYLRLKWAAV